MMKKENVNIAILASGSGTNAENIIRYFKQHDTIKISLVISNKQDAYVLQRAANLQVDAITISAKEWKDEKMVTAILDKYKIDFLVLAGYLLLIPAWLVKRYADNILNIHPALLPAYGGKGMYGDHVHKAVIEAGEKESGITIHYVNEHFDQGDAIFQAKCPVFSADTPKTLATRIHALEYRHFPEVIEKVILGD